MGNGCHAEHGPLALQWGKCKLTLNELCNQIRRLPKRQLWRYGQAGDLPARTEEIEQLARANGRRPVICYTHRRNFDAIRRANELGFHINISADNFDEADSFARQGLSTVMVLPSEYGRGRKRGSWAESLTAYRGRIADFLRTTKCGTKIAICPASYHDVTCAECGACAGPRPNNTIIGFPAHGSRKAAVDRQLTGYTDMEAKSRQGEVGGPAPQIKKGPAFRTGPGRSETHGSQWRRRAYDRPPRP